ncbi:30S ribosomal protein S4 [bacterium]|nr:30S ribosomal protein S4 [bacterium]
MGRYTGPRCRLCRREQTKLFLKGERCYTEKCAVSRREGVPGASAGGRRRGKNSDYGIMLREKQKVKRTYGLYEKQFLNYFKQAAASKGVTGESLLQLLETRIDNVVYKLGFANSISMARQLVRHNHFLLNGKKANIPSIILNEGDRLEVKAKSREKGCFKRGEEDTGPTTLHALPEWLTLEWANFSGTVSRLPIRADIDPEINEQLIVEYYSK